MEFYDVYRQKTADKLKQSEPDILRAIGKNELI